MKTTAINMMTRQSVTVRDADMYIFSVEPDAKYYFETEISTCILIPVSVRDALSSPDYYYRIFKINDRYYAAVHTHPYEKLKKFKKSYIQTSLF